MKTLQEKALVKFTKTEFGTIRIGKSRVSLDSVVHHFKLGASAEQIFHKFPSLDLADIYGVISYYLTNQEAVEDYLQGQEIQAAEIASEVEERFGKQNADIRARLLARKAELSTV